MVTLLTVVHITVCVFLILVVLLQAGKGGGMGIAFGGAGSQTVFGSSGAGNFLTRLTSITATVFIVTSLALAHYSSRQDSKRLQELAEQKAVEKKVTDEKAEKLKADLEKQRSATVAKDGGAATGPTTPGTDTTPSLPPIQLKMPGALNDTGAGKKPAGDVGATAPTEAPGRAETKSNVVPAPATTATKPGSPKAPAARPAAPATTPAGPAEGTGAPAAGDTAPKPAQKRRKPGAPAAVAPAARTESGPPPPAAPEAPAPAAPAE
jgi:preprotein translocase subunit SecG